MTIRRKILTAIAALVLGTAVAAISVSMLKHLLADPAVEQCVRTGKIGDKPMVEGRARIVGQQCRDQIERDGIKNRFENTHNAIFVFVIYVVVFFFDPLDIGLAILFSIIAYFALNSKIMNGLIP